MPLCSLVKLLTESKFSTFSYVGKDLHSFVLHFELPLHLTLFRYPLKAVKVMHTVALRTESSLYDPSKAPSLVARPQV
jgi:hypothetical protein